jgi:small-conductance mechanosensitive channel
MPGTPANFIVRARDLRIFHCILLVAALLLLLAAAPAEAQSGAAGVAKDAVSAVTGGNGSGQQAEYPYKDKETPESLQGWVDYILNFPLYRTGGEWIRLHQLVWALVILIIGIWLSVLAGRIVKRRLVHFKRMPGHIAIAVSKGLVYLLSFLVLIGTVLFVGMPFSIVSILGAVVLLGASLGAKNTIYDYMSGLVLALEQPVRIGDCIEVSEYAGFVEEIRGRYTRVRRFDGIDVLVPNSKFLEEEIVNWTLHDSKLRAEVKVGVEYGSDVDAVMDVLASCMQEREDILSEPAPSVLFWDFGDSALVLKLFFWLEVDNPLDMWSVESELRRVVINKLHESDISIAYPQRDLHLDAPHPLKIDLHDGRNKTGRSPDTGRSSRKSAADEERRRNEEQVAKPEGSQKQRDAKQNGQKD